MNKAKVILGNKPKTFAPFPVSFTLPDGTTGTMTVVFKYRTKTEYGDFLNRVHSDAGLEYEEAEKVDFEKVMAKAREKTADLLLEVLESWDLDVDLNIKTLSQFNDEMPAGSIALLSAYASACTQGRLGN